ncbi:MAG: M23 family metallopeptidase [bacterium]|nr:M23 family metallopeptidase [bacterium]
MAKRRRRQLSVLVIPDDGSRTLEFKLSYWLLRIAVGALILLLALVALGGSFYWKAHKWQRVAHSYKRENTRLRTEVERIEELANVVIQMKQIDQQLRTMLSPITTLPPAAYSTPTSSRAMFAGTSESTAQVRTVQGLPQTGQQASVDARWIPSIWPVSPSIGWVTAEFGNSDDVIKNRHGGIDIAAPAETPIYATADGKVVYADVHETLGFMVAIDHYGVFLTRYGHNASLLVSVGEQVRKGQPIALVGSSGHSSGPHVHYEVLVDGQPQNPRQYLPN